MNDSINYSALGFGDQLVQFETDWSSGQIPNLASYFRDFRNEDRQLIVDLIEIDLECRWKKFNAVSDRSMKDPYGFPQFPLVEDYAALLPEPLQQMIFTPHCVAEEYRVRLRWGDKPNKRSFFERFPSHQTEIEYALDQIDTDFKNEGIQISVESALTHTVDAHPTVILSPTVLKDSSLLSDANFTGQQFGKYQLEARLGHGAFGEVWKAYDPDLKRDVAIKFPRLDRRFHPDLLEIFRTEAQKLAMLGRKRIPGIVTVFECGELDGKPYFVSDFIEGESLAARMRREKFSHEESAQLLAKVAKALQQAHEQNVVHRDIKPANILLDQEGNPYLADFGLAISEDEQETEPESIVGTYAYMAPEQAKAKSHAVDGRADIYSLGVILYRMLTGKLPYTADTGEAYIEKILNHKIKPPSQRDATIPVELERICLKCLKKDEDERYSSAGELVRELQRYQRYHTKSTSHYMPIASVLLLLLLIAVGGYVASRSGALPSGPTTEIENLSPTKDLDQITHILKTTDQEKERPAGSFQVNGYPAEEIKWPGYNEEEIVDWHPNHDHPGTLVVSSKGLGLIALGDITEDLAERGVSIEVDIEKFAWKGSTGIFWGYREITYDGQLQGEMQLLRISQRTENKKIILQVERGLVRVDPDQNTLRRIMNSRVVPVELRNQKIHVTVILRDNQLVNVFIDQQRLDSLLTDPNNEYYQPENFVGKWGVYNDFDTSWYTDPNLTPQ